MEKQNELSDHQKYIKSMEKSILKKQNQIDCRMSTCAHYNFSNNYYSGASLDLTSDICSNKRSLYFYFCYLSYYKFIKSISPIPFFDMSRCTVYHIPGRNKHILNFISCLFPNKVDDLWISFSTQHKVTIFPYLHGITKITHRILNKMWIGDTFISIKQLKRLFSAVKHLKEFGLYRCTFSIPIVSDFSKSLINCRIRQLQLVEPKLTNERPWKSNIKEFENLIRGLATSLDLKQSLKEIEIRDSGIFKSRIQELLSANGFTSVILSTVPFDP
ncbi:unnamed protein product [Moneuplotes crassus]|uniref:Uncharacterized protein n=1 Tax=Euplotes crassus TaxID=5936 RepID=A0AAD1UJC9_EUPCR|nr:unnamed protein product [Moneuplotes crassus]